MEYNFSVLLQDDFMDLLIDTQQETERLGLNCVSNIFILKSLIYAKESNLKDVLNYAGVSWKKIESSIGKQIKLYIKNEKNVEYASLGEQDETGDFAVYCNTKTKETLENAVYYLLDCNEVGEVEFVLSMLGNYDIYVEGFFRGINIDTRLIEGYYRSLDTSMRTSSWERGNNVDDEYDEDEEYEDEGDEFDDSIEPITEDEYQAMMEYLDYEREKKSYQNRKVKAMMVLMLFEDEDKN